MAFKKKAIAPDVRDYLRQGRTLKEMEQSLGKSLFGYVSREDEYMNLYSQSLYSGVNRDLRSPSGKPDLQISASAIQDTLATMPNYDGIAYRGISVPNLEEALNKFGISKGAIYSDPAFTSYSQDLEIAKDFAKKSISNRDRIIFTTSSRSGSLLGSYAQYGAEKEILFPAGFPQKVKSVDVRKEGTSNVAYVELQDTPESAKFAKDFGLSDKKKAIKDAIASPETASQILRDEFSVQPKNFTSKQKKNFGGVISLRDNASNFEFGQKFIAPKTGEILSLSAINAEGSVVLQDRKGANLEVPLKDFGKYKVKPSPNLDDLKAGDGLVKVANATDTYRDPVVGDRLTILAADENVVRGYTDTGDYTILKRSQVPDFFRPNPLGISANTAMDLPLKFAKSFAMREGARLLAKQLGANEDQQQAVADTVTVANVAASFADNSRVNNMAANKKINTGSVSSSVREPKSPKLTTDTLYKYLQMMGGDPVIVKPDGSQPTKGKFAFGQDVGLNNEFTKLPEIHTRFDDPKIASMVAKELATGELTVGMRRNPETGEIETITKKFQPVPSRGNTQLRQYSLGNDPTGRYLAFNKPEEAYKAPPSLKELQADLRKSYKAFDFKPDATLPEVEAAVQPRLNEVKNSPELRDRLQTVLSDIQNRTVPEQVTQQAIAVEPTPRSKTQLALESDRIGGYDITHADKIEKFIQNDENYRAVLGALNYADQDKFNLHIENLDNGDRTAIKEIIPYLNKARQNTPSFGGNVYDDHARLAFAELDQSIGKQFGFNNVLQRSLPEFVNSGDSKLRVDIGGQAKIEISRTRVNGRDAFKVDNIVAYDPQAVGNRFAMKTLKYLNENLPNPVVMGNVVNPKFRSIFEKQGYTEVNGDYLPPELAPQKQAIAQSPQQTLDTPSDAWKFPQQNERKLPNFYPQMASGENPLGTGATVQSTYDRAKSAYEGYQDFGYAPRDREFPTLREMKKLAESEGVKGDEAIKAYIKGKQNAPLIEAGVITPPELPMTARLGQEYISPRTGKIGTVESVGKKGVKLNVDGQAIPIEYETLERLKYTGNKQWGFGSMPALRPANAGLLGGTLGAIAFKQLAKAAGLNEDQQNIAAGVGGVTGAITGGSLSLFKPTTELKAPTARQFAQTVMGIPAPSESGMFLTAEGRNKMRLNQLNQYDVKPVLSDAAVIATDLLTPHPYGIATVPAARMATDSWKNNYDAIAERGLAAMKTTATGATSAIKDFTYQTLSQLGRSVGLPFPMTEQAVGQVLDAIPNAEQVMGMAKSRFARNSESGMVMMGDRPQTLSELQPMKSAAFDIVSDGAISTDLDSGTVLDQAKKRLVKKLDRISPYLDYPENLTRADLPDARSFVDYQDAQAYKKQLQDPSLNSKVLDNLRRSETDQASRIFRAKLVRDERSKYNIADLEDQLFFQEKVLPLAQPEIDRKVAVFRENYKPQITQTEYDWVKSATKGDIEFVRKQDRVWNDAINKQYGLVESASPRSNDLLIDVAAVDVTEPRSVIEQTKSLKQLQQSQPVGDRELTPEEFAKKFPDRAKAMGVKPISDTPVEMSPRSSSGEIFEAPLEKPRLSLREMLRRELDAKYPYSAPYDRTAKPEPRKFVPSLTFDRAADQMSMSPSEYRAFQDRVYAEQKAVQSKPYQERQSQIAKQKFQQEQSYFDALKAWNKAGDPTIPMPRKEDFVSPIKNTFDFKQTLSEASMAARSAESRAKGFGKPQPKSAIAQATQAIKNAGEIVFDALYQPSAANPSRASSPKQSNFIAESEVQKTAAATGVSEARVKAEIANQRASGEAPNLSKATEAIATRTKRSLQGVFLPDPVMQLTGLVEPKPFDNQVGKQAAFERANLAFEQNISRPRSLKQMQQAAQQYTFNPPIPEPVSTRAKTPTWELPAADFVPLPIPNKVDPRVASAKQIGDRINRAVTKEYGSIGLAPFMDTAQAANVLTESVSRGENAPTALTRAGVSVGAGYAATGLASFIPNPYLRTAAQLGGGIAAVVGADKAIDAVVGRNEAKEQKYAKDLSKLDLQPTNESEQWKPFANDSNALAAYGNSFAAQIQSNLDYRPAARSLANLANNQSIENARYQSERQTSLQAGMDAKSKKSIAFEKRDDGTEVGYLRNRGYNATESRVLALQNLANEHGYEVPRTGKFEAKTLDALEKLGYSQSQISAYIQGKTDAIGKPNQVTPDKVNAAKIALARSRGEQVSSSELSAALSAERKAQGLKGGEMLNQGQVDRVFQSLAGRSLSQLKQSAKVGGNKTQSALRLGAGISK